MIISVTQDADAQLKRYGLSSEDHIRLVYDAEGCGCAVSGVASLWIVSAAESDEVSAETFGTEAPITYLRRHEVFFEERMTLGYSAERRAFRLSSDGQIYSSSIVVSDRRGALLAQLDAPR